MGYHDVFLLIIVAWVVAVLMIVDVYLRTRLKVAVPPMLLAEIVVVTMILAFIYLLLFQPEPYRT